MTDIEELLSLVKKDPEQVKTLSVDDIKKLRAHIAKKLCGYSKDCSLHDYPTFYGVCNNDGKERCDACQQYVCQEHSTRFSTFTLCDDLIICDRCASQDIEFVYEGYLCKTYRMIDAARIKDLKQIYNPMIKVCKE